MSERNDNHAEYLKSWMVQLEKMEAQERAEWALIHLPPKVALSSSFGIQSAVSLHMLTQIKKDIPVILIDTGYLFPETYQYIDRLTQLFDLNLKIFKSQLSPAWFESRYGELWEKGLEGIEQYNEIMKVQPMRNALKSLGVQTWFSGIRNTQSATRKHKKAIELAGVVYKVNPLFDWTEKDVYEYIMKHKLPQHPLWEKGYVSIGDTHTTLPLSEHVEFEQTRFRGLKRECGIQDINM